MISDEQDGDGHLLIDELAQRDLRPPLDLEPDEAVDLLPVPLLQALVAEVDDYGEHRAEVVHILLTIEQNPFRVNLFRQVVVRSHPATLSTLAQASSQRGGT